MSGSRLGLVLLALIALAPAPVCASSLVADLSSHSIAITTGFTGASVVLFGAIDGPGDVIAVVRGPERDVTVWRKGKVAGIWANAEDITFINVPSAGALYKIGTDNLKFETTSPTDPDRLKLFANALIDVRKRAGVFSPNHEKIAFLGDKLFRTTFYFPTNIPTGAYLVEVFLVHDKDVVGGQTTPLIVSKVGVDAAVFDFAHRNSLAYGAIAVMMAVMAGWIASLPFRST
jgi:hypothetical protein